MFDFEKLNVYQKGKLLNKGFYKLLQTNRKIPQNYKSQLIRASLSVTANIAEGTGKFTIPDKKNFFTIARASVYECASIIDLLFDFDLISKAEFKFLYDLLEEISRMLLGLIRSLEKGNAQE